MNMLTQLGFNHYNHTDTDMVWVNHTDTYTDTDMVLLNQIHTDTDTDIERTFFSSRYRYQVF